MSWLGRSSLIPNLLVVPAYLLMAAVGVLLTPSPQIIANIWPPTGLCLMAILIDRRVAPGVFLGQFLTLLLLRYHRQQEIDLHQLSVMGVMCFSSVLNALLGAYLVRSITGFPTRLDRPWLVILFLILGGLVPALLSATVGTAVMYFAAQVSRPQIWMCWWAWWIGDAMGVLTLAPIFLAFLASPRRDWHYRRWWIAAPMLGCILLVVIGFRSANAFEVNAIDNELERTAETISDDTRRSFTLYLETISSMRSYFTLHPATTRQEFYQVTADALRRHPAIRALEWVPRVTPEDVPAVIAAARADGIGDFAIRTQGSDGQRVPTPPKAEYFPVVYIEPFENNRNAMGFDMTSSAVRRDAMERALASSTIEATAPLQLVQEAEPRPGFLLIAPVFKGATPVTLQQRHDKLLGYVIGGFHARDVMANSIDPDVPQLLRVELYDTTDGNNRVLLSVYDLSNGTFLSELTRTKPDAQHLVKTRTLSIAGREYFIRLVPMTGYLAATQTYRIWVVPAAGLLLTGLLGAFLITITGNAAATEGIVHERTGALREALANLGSEVAIRARAESALRASEERFRSLSSQAPIGIFQADALGHCTYINATWTGISGQNTEAALGMGWTQVIEPEDRSRVVERWREDAGALQNFQMEYRIRREDGEIRWVRMRAIPMQSQVGHAWGFVGTIQDITEQRQTQHTLQAAKEQSEAASRSKSEFLANMSHEIRTPMTAILGFTELLANDAAPPDYRASWLSTIRRNGEHLLTILNDILDISKIEAGKMTVERVPMDPVQIVEDVVSLLQPRAIGKQVTLSRQFEGLLPVRFPCDPLRFRQILLNLVGNAIKFTRVGSVEVIIRFREDLQQLQLVVRDTGIGIAADQLDYLFDAFTQADSSTTRKFGGSGLGLMISRRFARMLGGDISVRSQVDQGSEFTLVLPTGPMLPGQLRDPYAAQHPEAIARLSSDSLKGIRILLVEDGVDNQMLIGFILRKAGAQMSVANTGREALDMLSARPGDFDLVLMDMQMPEMDGYDATRLLKQRGCPLPIVALTAHAMAEDRERCLRAGCDDYLSKPVDPRQLIDTCAAAVQGARSRS